MGLLVARRPNAFRHFFFVIIATSRAGAGRAQPPVQAAEWGIDEWPAARDGANCATPARVSRSRHTDVADVQPGEVSQEFVRSLKLPRFSLIESTLGIRLTRVRKQPA